MKQLLSGILAACALLFPLSARAQNIEGQIIASQYGEWRVQAIPQPASGNSFDFVAASCTQIAGGKSFQAFVVGTPITIYDADPSQNETVTPSAVSSTNQGCSIAVTPVHTHHSFSLGSATAGLQEALNANLSTASTNSIVLTARWYQMGGSTGIIGSVHGNTSLNLVDITTTPYTWYHWNGSIYAEVPVGSGGNPASPPNAIQLANGGVDGFASDSNFLINPTTHTLTSLGNAVFNALSSFPRATYDPMDTTFDGGLAAAIAGTSGYTPTQVIQAAIDYGECQILMGQTSFHWINIPMPSGITMNISGIKLWSHTSIGSDHGPGGAYLQHNDASQPMISAHGSSDTIACSDGHTYTPGLVGGLLIHDLAIGGMGAVNSVNDVGIELNAFSSAADNIIGFSNAFGAAAIVSNGTSTFMTNIGYPGSQVAGCYTFNAGVQPVSNFTIGQGHCAAVMDLSLDGGMANIYASDGWATHDSTHPAGACYPNCGGVLIGGSGTYDYNIFPQVSSVGLLVKGMENKINMVRVDYTSREAIQLTSFGAAGGGSISQVIIDSPCTDKTLQSNYTSGIATGCFAVDQESGNGYSLMDLQVINNAGILAPAYVQAWVHDSETGGTGQSSVWDLRHYQGSTGNTTANDWALAGQFAGDFASGRAIFPTIAPVAATGTTVNVSGINAIRLGGQTVSSITGGIGGQHVFVTGPGTMHQGTGIASNNIQNLNGLDNVLATNQTVEYVNVDGLPNSVWVMVAGPPNPTPWHVNYAGNSTPSNPSLLDVFGNVQARQVPGFTLDVSQLHGAGTTGQACFEQQALFPDGSSVVSPLACTTVDLATMTPGEIFTSTINSTATPVLWLATNTQPSAVATGKFAAPSGGQWSYTLIAAGGDGSTPPAASENTTGSAVLAFGVYGPATAPSGSCTAGQGGATVISQDGHGTYCPTGGGTWTSKW